jgi:large subunit ribosomal protein L5
MPDEGAGDKTMARLREAYHKEVVPKLMEQFGYRNPMSVPRLSKICLNVGVGKARENPKLLESAVEGLSTVAGQRAVVTKARKAISTWRLRKGYQIGAKVTLRGAKMYEFFDRLVNVALPRVRDFRGMSPRSFDGRGNYSLGLAELTIFPEVDADKIEFVHGMDITIATTAKTDEEGRALLTELGFPFRK